MITPIHRISFEVKHMMVTESGRDMLSKGVVVCSLATKANFSAAK